MTGLAEMQLAGCVDVDGLDDLDDRLAVAALTSVRGVGRWSAEMFLIHQLRRPDVLPAGDLGIRRGVEAAWDLPAAGQSTSWPNSPESGRHTGRTRPPFSGVPSAGSKQQLRR